MKKVADSIGISIVNGDAKLVPADALVLKYSQSIRGLEGEIMKEMESAGKQVGDTLPGQHAFLIADGKEVTSSKNILFIGVPELSEFGYREIREFGKKAMSVLGAKFPSTRSIIMTMHGTGYGLDEREAFESQLAGIMESVKKQDIPSQLLEICFVEKLPKRAARLQKYLEKYFPERRIPNPGIRSQSMPQTRAIDSLESMGMESDEKKRVFVAMPFDPEFDDYFHYGIKGPVNEFGYLCERADLEAYTGDVLEWVKTRIKGAAFIIADLTGANPNVYLEVGYAWGKNKKTILIIKSNAELRFDTRGQKCIRYENIKDLETKLREEIGKLSHVK